MKKVSLYSYISRNYSRYHALIDYFHMKPLFTKQHTTAIIPSASTINHLEELKNNDKYIEAEAILRAHVIKCNLPNADEWERYKNMLINTSSQLVKFSLASRGSSRIAIGDAIIAPVEKFAQLQAETTSLYEVISGNLTPTDDAPVNPAELKAKAEIRRPVYKITREAIMLNIQNQVSNEYTVNRNKPRKIFAEYLFSLLDFLLKTDKGMFFDRVYPICGFDDIDLYFLIEPYKSTNTTIETDYLLPTETIMKWWVAHSRGNLETLQKKVFAKIEESLPGLEKTHPCALYSNKEQLLHALDKFQSHKFETVITGQTGIISWIIISQQLYRALAETNNLYDVGEYTFSLRVDDTTNRLGNVLFENVFPAGIANFYKKFPLLKLTQDSVRHEFHTRLAILYKDMFFFDRVDFDDCIKTMMRHMRAMRGGRYLDIYYIHNRISDNTEIYRRREFCKSTSYLFVPRTFEETTIFQPKLNTQNIIYRYLGVKSNANNATTTTTKKDYVAKLRKLVNKVDELPEDLRELLSNKLK